MVQVNVLSLLAYIFVVNSDNESVRVSKSISNLFLALLFDLFKLVLFLKSCCSPVREYVYCSAIDERGVFCLASRSTSTFTL